MYVKSCIGEIHNYIQEYTPCISSKEWLNNLYACSRVGVLVIKYFCQIFLIL